MSSGGPRNEQFSSIRRSFRKRGTSRIARQTGGFDRFRRVLTSILTCRPRFAAF